MNFELTDLSNVTERAGCAGCSCRHSEQMFALFIYLFFAGNYCAPAHSPRETERGSKKLVASSSFSCFLEAQSRAKELSVLASWLAPCDGNLFLRGIFSLLISHFCALSTVRGSVVVDLCRPTTRPPARARTRRESFLCSSSSSAATRLLIYRIPGCRNRPRAKVLQYIVPAHIHTNLPSRPPGKTMIVPRAGLLLKLILI
jgi:hypothetical protein